MTGLLPLGFTSPWILMAVALLPAIWWLLRLIPPRPQQVDFPPTRLLARIARVEETPNHSPWWLTALRLTLAALLILALAGPIWRPLLSETLGKGPLWLIVDNGWGAATSWKERQTLALSIIDRASDQSRPIALIGTAEGPAQTFAPVSAAEARSRLQALEPRGWTPDRIGLLSGLRQSFDRVAPGTIVWLSDGLDNGSGKDFGKSLGEMVGPTPITVYRGGTPLPLALTGTDNGLKSLDATVVRVEADVPLQGRLRALDLKSRTVAEADVSLLPGEHSATAHFELPTELRNDIARIEIVGQPHAGAVQLLDERWHRRAVGLISGVSTDVDQPLLSPVHYLEAALKPFADVRQPPGDDLAKSVKELLRQNVSVIMTADVGTIVGETGKSLEDWVSHGGVLIRFAGPKLAAVKGGDRLIPVDLRQGGRSLGGALSWSKPQALANFSANGPFASLPVPKDVNVTRQVLAEQNPDLERRTWASLADGTPLVTASRLGNGWIVLFHVTADTGWSNLPLSGSFIDMLRRIIAFSLATPPSSDSAVAPGGKVYLAPLRILDGFGRSASPSAEAKPIAEGEIGLVPSREHPPGLYGSEDAFVALEPLSPGSVIAPLDLSGLPDARIESYANEGPRDLKPAILLLAVLALIADTLAVLVISGQLRLPRRRGIAAVLWLALPLGFVAMTAPPEARAGDPVSIIAANETPATAKPAAPPVKADPNAERFDRDAALGMRLAYVLTGNNEIDDTSKRGLEGLTRLMADRTALEAASPLGVDVSRDELAFFPLLYWPVAANAPQPTAATLSRIDAYMKGGGTILFDTRDALASPALTGSGRVSPATAALRRILASLDIPELEPVPSDHVLTKSFYLLQEFPGRFQGGQLWVEATPAQSAAQSAERPVRPGDGVSPIIISSNDLAGAWALTDGGDFLLPTVPPDLRQREMAFRVGVNIVMYTLTGNYKADQVHIPALLERLGQ